MKWFVIMYAHLEEYLVLKVITFLSCDVIGTSVTIMWCWWYCQWHHCMLAQDNWNKMLHHLFGHVMPLPLALTSCDTDGILNSIIAFIRSWWLKCGATWLFWSYQTIGSNNGTVNSITVFIRSRLSEWGHVILLASTLASHSTYGIISGTTAFVETRQSKWSATLLSVMWSCWH